jgi:hypothetical protein
MCVKLNEMTQPRSERPTGRITIDLPRAMAERIELDWRATAVTRAERIRALLAKGLEAERQA